MKTIHTLVFLFCFAGAVPAEPGCSKTEPCTGERKTSSPFLEASRAEPAKAVKAAVKQAPAKAAAAEPAPSPAVPQPEPVPATGGRTCPLASPGWLLLVAAGMALLYYYLKDKPGPKSRSGK